MSSPTQSQAEYRKPDFCITCDLAPGTAATVVCQGKMRLEDTDEKPITELLNRVIEKAYNTDQVILDLRHLEFMNSQGISVLFKFAINLRQKNIGLNVLAVKSSVWQQTHLDNIPKLAPDSIINWTDAVD
jgi:anti-anti-sigma factor